MYLKNKIKRQIFFILYHLYKCTVLRFMLQSTPVEEVTQLRRQLREAETELEQARSERSLPGETQVLTRQLEATKHELDEVGTDC